MKVYPVKLTADVLAVRYKPKDFYHNDPEKGDLWLDDERLAEASKLVLSLLKSYQAKSATLLICKMADGIREYNRLINCFIEANLPDDWKWGREIIKKAFPNDNILYRSGKTWVIPKSEPESKEESK